jgi:hypothetical protein
MDVMFAKPEGPISVASMVGRGAVALAFGAVVMAIFVPFAYFVNDGVTTSKRLRNDRLGEARPRTP